MIEIAYMAQVDGLGVTSLYLQVFLTLAIDIVQYITDCTFVTKNE